MIDTPIPSRDDPCRARAALPHHAPAPSYVCLECGTQCLIEEAWLDRDYGIQRFAEMPCTVNHDAIQSNFFGEHWSVCIHCGVQVERLHMPTGPQGADWGVGRTGSPRAQADFLSRLEYMRWFYHPDRHER